jgi:uncharacterized protein (TIGR02453 family)
MSTFFTPEFNRFFIELAPNNNKDWFDANRSRYEQFVREPFRKFADELIAQISKHDPGVRHLGAKDVMFRINRDIRFSKDKFPYKMHMAAAVSARGKKEPDICGFYVQLNPEMIQIWQGAYFVEPATMNQLRHFIANDLKTFNKLIRSKKFTDKFGEVEGDGNSRLPKELKDAAAEQPLLLHKNLYWGAQLSPKLISSEDLMKTIMDHYKAGKPLADFLDAGMGV